MTLTNTSDLWWKTAVVYCLDVETYFDSDGDGIGDLPGIVQRLDYLAELGVTCLWLLPFYPSPDRHDGNDVTDHYGVDDRLGSLGDVVELVRTANDRGIRVIADLVVNHTSDQHAWFKAARRDTTNSFRDYYVWRSDPPPDTSKQVVFPDQEDSIWQLDDKTGEWFLHRFYKYQPDLNVTNPLVRDELAKVMGFWLELGLSGFRVDAVPFFLDTAGVDKSEAQRFADPHAYLRALRAFLGRRTGDGILLGEVNLPHEQQLEFFGGPEGDELTMMFDFIAMQRLYLSLARGDAGPLAEALLARPATSPDSQWATFVRNHDELTLDKLSDAERQEVFAAFGPEERMQLYGRGLKRRLPPMLDGDPRRLRMVYSLLFSLPGTPVLYYGEEIGMGEDLDADGRMAVRTPMQWTAEAGAGFSTAPAKRLVSPVVQGGYGPEHVNVADQKRDHGSMWHFMATLIRRYRECPELGWGRFEVLEQPHRQVFAHRSTWEDGCVVARHNRAPEAVTVPLALSDAEEGSHLIDLLQPGEHELGRDGRVEVALDGYGYRWLRLAGPDDRQLP
jgi:trehalose synthase